jgi:hypothetical protein
MEQFPAALAHGSFEEVFPNVFFITGTMETVLMEKDWQFSRNMTVVREGTKLVVFNSIRLNDDGLAKLESLGTVTDVIRVGGLHGRDDAFYVDRYDATYWTLPELESEHCFNKIQTLHPDAKLPIPDASVFLFEKTQVPESVIHLEREEGILIGCDAIQSWAEADEFFSEESIGMMQEMDFFKPANVGPVWMQAANPVADDFIRLLELDFKHALCGHGQPLYQSAKEDYHSAFSNLFRI